MAAETDVKEKPNVREGQKQLKIWLPEDEKSMLTAKAKEAGMTVTDWVRHRCLKTAPRRRRKGADVQELFRITGQLSSIGNNINQLAHEANLSSELPTVHELYEIRKELSTMTSHLVKALGYDTQG